MAEERDLPDMVRDLREEQAPEKRPEQERSLFFRARELLPETGACYNCGYLSRQSTVQPQALITEISDADRTTGTWFRWQNATGIHCYRDIELYGDLAGYLGWEPQAFFLADQQKVVDQNAGCNAIFTKDRKCDKWTLHKPGRDPDAHLRLEEMLDLEKMRQASADTQRAIMDGLKEIAEEHAKTAQIQADILQRMERDEKAVGRQTAHFNWVLVGLTIAAVLLAFGALMYPTGATWLDWIPGQRSTQIQQSIPDTATSQPQPTS